MRQEIKEHRPQEYSGSQRYEGCNSRSDHLPRKGGRAPITAAREMPVIEKAREFVIIVILNYLSGIWPLRG
ncbi:MAG: hypothetical protein KAU50_01065, partial [Candidatus Marinimicrobia bacterium]|nr:hypothetical protein [Candidatus Neomarinimicrobiota bacterium]